MIEIFLVLSMALTSSPALIGEAQAIDQEPVSVEQEIHSEIDNLLVGVGHGQ